MTAAKPSPLVPKLRFAEFRDAPGWVQTPLGDAFKTITNGHANAQDHQDDGAYPLFDRSEVVKRSPTFLFDAEAVILPGEGMRFQPRYFNGKFDLHQRAYALMEPTVDPRFAFHALDRFKGALADSAVQSTVLSLRMPIIEKFAIPCPTSDDEQQKIADCLGSLDDLIAAEGRKLEALRQHKQGLMQQLFPLPGETRPRLRFPEFEDAPEWESRELGLMTSKIGSGVTPRGGEKNYRSSGRPFVRSQNVGWGEFILDNVVHIDEDTHASFAATEVEEGDVLLNISGASIGRSAVADARIAGGNVNQHVCIIRCLSEHIQAWFLSQYLISKHGQDQIDSCQAGGNRQGLNFGQIRSFLIPQPRDVAEQERIADCLRAADIILATQAQRISALKRQKQGSLQQLFPSLVEG